MKNTFNRILKNGIGLCLLTLFLGACTYQNVGEAVFPQPLVYLPAATGGFYNVDRVVATGAKRYVIDGANKKFNVPLAAFRSGTAFDGEFMANLAANSDTINKLIAAAKLTGVELLTAENFTLPTSVTGASGADNAPFNLSVNLDYLRNNPTKKFAIGITASSTAPAINVGLSTAIIVIDAKMVKPTAAFTTSVAGKKVTFTNTSTYGVSYNWNFGNGSAASTATAPVFTYVAAGTYTVTLTTTGITGSADAATKTMTVTVL